MEEINQLTETVTLFLQSLDPNILMGSAAGGGVLLLSSLYFLLRKKPVPPQVEEKSVEETTKEVTSTAGAEETLQQETAAVEETEVEKTLEVVEPATTAEVEESISLDKALEKTKTGFLGKLKGIFSDDSSSWDEQMEELEEVLYTSDLGPRTVEKLMSGVDERLSRKDKKDFTLLREALKSEVTDIFSELTEQDPFPNWLEEETKKPLVLMVVGVNGAGKTTTIGKISRRFSSEGKKVLIAAGDTFRAAAGDQLKVWSERAEVEIYFPENVTDPSAVAFDALQSARSKGYDVLIVDTAGRLHTQSNLMEELKKMKRVLQKVDETAPHEVLLVLDANSGQNALLQAKNFNEAVSLSGVVLTKLDGTAKGGVAVAVAHELAVPIRLIGVGEGISDLRPFNSQEFVDSIL